jgi:hypothetical protein
MHKLPELFQAIIDHDNTGLADKSVVNLREWRAWRWRRRDLSKAAEAYVKAQRGGK